MGKARPRSRAFSLPYSTACDDRPGLDTRWVGSLIYLAHVASRSVPLQKITRPLPTKDGGTLRTIQDARDYSAVIGKEREQRRHWQQVRQLILEEANAEVVSCQIRLAVLKDAKLDVSKVPAK